LLTEQIKQIHKKKKQTYGSKKITKELCRNGKTVNHKRVERFMKNEHIRSKVVKKYKATTNSKHDLPVAENILNREFTASKPNQKMVSDITYVWTEEGWLYAAGIIDLCGKRVIGLSMGSRMTKELAINALKGAYIRTGRVGGAILHSDRGSQYCSNDYQELLKKYGYICSMSRKGNCWDNAPMEAFWGKMKNEWLHGKRFKTRDEAKAAIFEYIEIFYNRQRIHESNNYLTPDEYYYKAMAS
jgi:putative transposase